MDVLKDGTSQFLQPESQAITDLVYYGVSMISCQGTPGMNVYGLDGNSDGSGDGVHLLRPRKVLMLVFIALTWVINRVSKISLIDGYRNSPEVRVARGSGAV
jgi:hypothetical protein